MFVFKYNIIPFWMLHESLKFAYCESVNSHSKRVFCWEWCYRKQLFMPVRIGCQYFFCPFKMIENDKEDFFFFKECDLTKKKSKNLYSVFLWLCSHIKKDIINLDLFILIFDAWFWLVKVIYKLIVAQHNNEVFYDHTIQLDIIFKRIYI